MCKVQRVYFVFAFLTSPVCGGRMTAKCENHDRCVTNSGTWSQDAIPSILTRVATPTRSAFDRRQRGISVVLKGAYNGRGR
jgi:hypothetical protein